MSYEVIHLLSAGTTVSVGMFDFPIYETGPASHSFTWDGEGRIYLSRVSNSVAKVNVGSAQATLIAGNGRSITWSGRCGTYDVTYLWPKSGSPSRYVDMARYARSGETLVRQDIFLIISKGGIFCPVNMDIR